MLIKQIKVGDMDNFCYLISDNGECVIIDPGFEASKIIKEVGSLKIKAILLTHLHYDHDGEASTLSEKFSVPVLSSGNGLRDKDVISVGKVSITMHNTPGHSPHSVVYEVEGNLITGDTLFVEGCGRTDLPGSDPSAMEKTLDFIKTFPDDFKIYPGHDYGSKPISTIKHEKEFNRCLR
jgi:glyoxylase-like metal-dependent hydrolase (beta-lactamase superfamily II)